MREGEETHLGKDKERQMDRKIVRKRERRKQRRGGVRKKGIER